MVYHAGWETVPC